MYIFENMNGYRFLLVGLFFVQLFLIDNCLAQETSQVGVLEDLYSNARELQQQHPDSALIIFQKFSAMANEVGDSVYIIRSLNSIGNVYFATQQYEMAFDYLGEALFLSEQFSDTLIMAESYSNMGALNYFFYQKEEGVRFLRKGIEYYKMASEQKNIRPSVMTPSYFSMARLYSKFDDYKMASAYLDTCYALSGGESAQISRPYLDAEKGIINIHLKNYPIAKKMLYKAAKDCESLTEAEDTNNDRGYLPVIYSYIGELYRLTNKNDSAQVYYEKALSFLEVNKRHIDQKAFILERYGWLLFEMKMFKEAYAKVNEANTINEQYFSAKAISNGNLLTVRSHYKEQLAQKSMELNAKNLELAEKKQSILRIRIILFSIVFVLLLIGLFIRHRILSKRYRIEAENNRRKQEEAKALLEQKNKELTGSTLKLIEKEEHLKLLRNHIEELPNKASAKSVLSLTQPSKTAMWEDFNSRFIEVNNNFYERLTEKVPGLSPGDLKVCALVKLNFSSKEMAHLLGISIESVHKARHRLRKKINLERDVNLTSFIASI